MTQPRRNLLDTILLIGYYHFLLAGVSLIAALAILMFRIIPGIGRQPHASAQDLFIPLAGTIILVALGCALAWTGNGLMALKSNARVAAIFLALVGVFWGVLAALGVAAHTLLNRSDPDWFATGILAFLGLAIYIVLTLAGAGVMVFLSREATCQAFDGEPQTEPEQSLD